MKKLILISIISLLISGCGVKITNTEEPQSCGITNTGTCSTTGIINTGTSVVPASPDLESELQPLDTKDLNNVALNTLLALRNKDIDTLIKLSTEKGIRFSPYAYVETGTNIVLKAKDLSGAMTSKVQYVRGLSDGSGDPLNMTFKEYLNKFIYDVDYLKLSERFVNENLSRGNSINNVSDIYTGMQTIEFYVPGIDPKYEGMDWKSLTLIFEQINGEYKLIGIVHNQRTI